MSQEHWRYFLALENDLESCTRFIEPTPDNFGCYSIELARLLLGACSEIDVVAKVLCSKDCGTSAADNIEDYRLAITKKFPRLYTFVAEVPRHSLNLMPWSSWGDGVNPQWWQDHNKVKHTRHQNFKLANLKACFDAIAGLFALNLYLYREDLVGLRLDAESTRFMSLPPGHQVSRLVVGSYVLPDTW